MLKFPEQVGTPQHMATSSSLTAHLRSLSKGDSPGGSPFQNYSSIHSQSRSSSSPNLQSRSPTISNMAALRWAPTANPKGWELWNTEAQAPLVLSEFPLEYPSCAFIPVAQEDNACARAKQAALSWIKHPVMQECFGLASLKKSEGRGWEGFLVEWTI